MSPLRPLVLALAASVLGSACHTVPPAAEPRVPRADSIVLERSACYGTCPAYRLSLQADGRVAFIPTTGRGRAQTFLDSIAPSQVASLAQHAERIGFAQLPPVIADDSILCPMRATDHPTVTIALYRSASAIRVVDYRGCYTSLMLTIAPALAPLRAFASQIDSVAHAGQWIQHMMRH